MPGDAEINADYYSVPLFPTEPWQTGWGVGAEFSPFSIACWWEWRRTNGGPSSILVVWFSPLVVPLVLSRVETTCGHGEQGWYMEWWGQGQVLPGMYGDSGGGSGSGYPQLAMCSRTRAGWGLQRVFVRGARSGILWSLCIPPTWDTLWVHDSSQLMILLSSNDLWFYSVHSMTHIFFLKASVFKKMYTSMLALLWVLSHWKNFQQIILYLGTCKVSWCSKQCWGHFT